MSTNVQQEMEEARGSLLNPAASTATLVPTISNSGGANDRITRDFQHLYPNTAPPQWAESTTNLQTHLRAVNEAEQPKLARRYSRKHQFFHLLEKIAVRLLWSILLSGAMIGTFKYFEGVKVLSDTEKNVFNMLSTGIYLTIGLNLAGAFKGMATMLRWKLLARKPHNLKEVDLILGLNSLIKVARLGLNALGFGKPLVFISCLIWILINCVARVSVALTGLTYSYDSAGAITTELGIVHVSEKTRFWPLGKITDNPPEPGAEFQTAHFFGEYSALMADSSTEDDLHGERMIDWNNQTMEWEYTFREWNPDHPKLVTKSDRKITAKATCDRYDMIEGQDGTKKDVKYYNATDHTVYDLQDIVVRGPGATVWANPRADINDNPIWSCNIGPRCTVLASFQYIDPAKETGNGTLYRCAVNVGTVTNVKFPEHMIDDRMAWIAAGSIGLDGFSDDPQDWLYQRYFLGTPFGRRAASDPEFMAKLVSRFAIGTIATLDNDNPRVELVGNRPWAGVLFKVNWPQLYLILGGICIVQVVLGLIAVIWSNTVFVKDDSYLSTARLLRPLVERLGDSGCALTGKEIAATLKTVMVYGVRTDSSGKRHHLDMGTDIVPISKFPLGWYDGLEEGMVPYTDEEGDVEKGGRGTLGRYKDEVESEEDGEYFYRVDKGDKEDGEEEYLVRL
ncbi:hypothetical protein DFH27DRAFT_293035 [Peziza echinospora]|nr:hypothetical protein DFH27DRAFT_293035 [Peziza echinospora]